MAKNSKLSSFRRKFIEVGITIILVIIAAYIAPRYGYLLKQNGQNRENIEKSEAIERKKTVAEESENITLNKEEDLLKIYFFDVGEADSILLTHKNHAMLIDAGNNKDGKTVVNNIKNLGIKKLDYVVGTHPHSDHIGGLDNIIKKFEIGTFYMPNVTTNTMTFEEVLNAAEKKNLKVTTPKHGDKFNLGDVECEVMLCEENFPEEVLIEEDGEKNLNLYSIVIRATYKEQSYLFMADAEEYNEKSRSWPRANVLKVGHHGSNTSSSQEFLDQVKPEIAIIQVGKDNDYHHPHGIILNRLKKMNTKIYRTDEKGNILIESDGIKNRVSFY